MDQQLFSSPSVQKVNLAGILTSDFYRHIKERKNSLGRPLDLSGLPVIQIWSSSNTKTEISSRERGYYDDEKEKQNP